MKRRRHVEQHPLGAQFLGLFDRQFHRLLHAGDDNLAGIVVVGDNNHASRSPSLAGLFSQLQVRLADQGCHGADADRRGALHGLAAQFQQPCRIRQAERAGRRMGRVFAQAVAGDVFCCRARHTEITLKDLCGGQRHGHDRRLGVFGQGQLIFGAVLHQLEQLLAQRLVDFVEDVASAREILKQLCAHADALRTLSGKNES